MDVIENENRIEAVDYNPNTEMVFWVDSYNRSIKRSYMVNAKDGKVKIGYAQDLNLKGERKGGKVTFFLSFYKKVLLDIDLKY